MKTYDMILMLRRLAFGATLLTATALLPACDDDPAAPDEELTTDPGTSVQPETLRFISYNILEGMKLDNRRLRSSMGYFDVSPTGNPLSLQSMA